MSAWILRGDSANTSKKLWEIGAIAMGTVVLVGLGFAVVNAPRVYADAEQQAAAEIAAENREVCQRLGAPSIDRGVSDCAQELDRVRQRHEDRIAKRSAGFL